jgi:dihydrodipicolinate synthase/N-acetylneuraminate lyase
MGLNLNGVIAALPTPFNKEGEVDHNALRTQPDGLEPDRSPRIPCSRFDG